ncbi:prepilin-type N-terminal cleavage/methylation domain-containing protein [Leeuwenhoekiella aestuarii]|uniref:PulJ/GspJ family protein n=1 Tax=Leeuwenhoekiella aestuarii TaxID=2249426 RepID=UPI000FFE5379|nr:prepilin-type N-terminal cleavage/methylation domain-containing protein [Leeuwenhoekiella aestuarii]RXG11382.1 prepilin-type N-terminal cleavage/methylation domain-containing protein [Leeuwenhoekiella aestuarii]
MKTKLKINAFTLSEMLVVLALTAIVVGLAFTILNLVTKQVQLVSTNYNERSEIDKLEMALWIDFNSFETIHIDLENQTLVFNRLKSKMIYQFRNEFTLRNKDTLPKLDTLKTFYLGKQVQSGLLDAIELQIGKRQLFVYKRSDASNYLND